MINHLACPCDQKQPLVPGDTIYRCAGCARQFPVVSGLPILIRDENSVFAVADYLPRDPHPGQGGQQADRPSLVRRLYRRFAHFLIFYSPDLNYISEQEIIRRTVAENPAAKILVIGSGDKPYEAPPGATITFVDVVRGPSVQYICDAHDLPFADNAFDLVLIIAVLEHVADPQRCVAEIFRVLGKNGLVLSMVPFLQPVHMGRYDFTRFTHMGHRRLFRWFDTIETGMALGPSATLAWSVQYFLLSFSDNLSVRKVLRFAGYLLTFPVRFIDLFLKRRTGAIDAAGGTFFFGRKRESPISDREIIGMFIGRDSQ